MQNVKFYPERSRRVEIRNLFWRDRFNIIALSTSVLINLFIWLLFFFKITPQDAPVILHYNIYFGIDFIDQWHKVYFIPSIGLLFIALNLIIGQAIYKNLAFGENLDSRFARIKQEKLAAYFLSSASLFIQVLLVIASVCIVLAQ